MDSIVVQQEDLGNYDLKKKTIIWKSEAYNFDEYCYDGKEYVMYKIGVNDESIEIGRIDCKSGMLMLIETKEYYMVFEVIE